MKFMGDMGAGRKKIVVCLEEPLFELRMFIDTSAIEIYLNHGAAVMSTRYYPENECIMMSCNIGEAKGIYYKLNALKIK